MATSDQKHKNSLSSKDLSTIIKAAKEAGVTHLKYGSLEISFSQEQEVVTPEVMAPTLKPRPEDGTGPLPLLNNDNDLDELMLIDPLGYETKIAEQLAAGDES